MTLRPYIYNRLALRFTCSDFHVGPVLYWCGEVLQRHGGVGYHPIQVRRTPAPVFYAALVGRQGRSRGQQRSTGTGGVVSKASSRVPRVAHETIGGLAQMAGVGGGS